MTENSFSKTVKFLEDNKKALRAYLQSKFDAEDYHAVQDAASDIREIDARLGMLRLVMEVMGNEPA